jgi:hypothetical protein
MTTATLPAVDNHDINLLTAKAYQCAVREEGKPHAHHYLRELRLYRLDNPQDFNDARLDVIIDEQFARQVQTGQNTRAFWGVGPDEPWEFMTTEEVIEELSASQSWLTDADSFIAQKLEPRVPLMTDTETGGAFLFASSLNQIYAFRGQGKSVIANAIAKCLITGETWLRFQSPGNLKVLLMDGELPGIQLQERVQEFIGPSSGRLKILSPEQMPRPEDFPALSDKADQDRFIKEIAAFHPDVIIFDTLTRCFRFDTNDPDGWLVVNDFLIRLRTMGYCVILVHHQGKNGTSRGRTDGDDNMDTIVRLGAPIGWSHGDGLAVTWTWEKVRHGARLPEFGASYANGKWDFIEDDRAGEVIEMVGKGLSQRTIATKLKVDQSTVSRLVKRLTAKGLLDLNAKADASRDARQK